MIQFEEHTRDSIAMSPMPKVAKRQKTDTTALVLRSGPADSLAAQPQRDYSQSYPFLVYGTTDSLRIHLGEGSMKDEATVEEVFGPQSTVVSPKQWVLSNRQSLIDNGIFQGFVLLLAATYALLLYFNLDDVRTLISRISRDRSSGKRTFEESGNSGFSRFLNITTVIGMLFLGVMAVKYSDALLPASLLSGLPYAAVVATSLLVTALFSTVVLCQAALMRITGAVTLTQPFISQLQLLRRTYFALSVVVISPTLLLFALCPHGTGNVWFYVILIQVAITASLYLREAGMLFISKKISILHWFLYLCAVEAFPISLIWLIAVR